MYRSLFRVRLIGDLFPAPAPKPSGPVYLLSAADGNWLSSAGDPIPPPFTGEGEEETGDREGQKEMVELALALALTLALALASWFESSDFGP